MFALISIHALVKRATYVYITVYTILNNFNPRPREEGDSVKVGDTIKINDFNPRPREEGDIIFKYFVLYNIISIHALVKRATLKTQRQPGGQEISIHALVKRATTKCHFYPNHRQDFNPRPREEGDR